MPREAPRSLDVEAVCPLQEELSLQVIRYTRNQKPQVPSDWHSAGFGQGQKMGAVVPLGRCLQLPGILCSLL